MTVQTAKEPSGFILDGLKIGLYLKKVPELWHQHNERNNKNNKARQDGPCGLNKDQGGGDCHSNGKGASALCDIRNADSDTTQVTSNYLLAFMGAEMFFFFYIYTVCVFILWNDLNDALLARGAHHVDCCTS